MLRALLVVLCTALALVVAGNSALAIALPQLATDVGAGQTELTWIVDAYALTFAALLLPAGIAADRVGRRTVLVAGLLVFGGACLASAFATDPPTLIVLRAVAGAGAAAVFPVTLSALVDSYPEERRAFAVAVWSAVSAIGAVAGTIVAGVLLEFFWWGSIQLVFGALAVVLIVPVALLVVQQRNPQLSLDPLGAGLSVVALGGIVYGIIEAPVAGWGGASTIGALAVGGAALAGFVVHELRSRAPSLDVRLFRSRGLSTGSLIVSVQFFASLGLFVLAPQYLQIARDLEPLQAALALLVIPVGVGAGTGLATGLLRRAGAAVVGAAGLAVMGAGFATLAAALLAAGGSLPWLVVGLLVFGLGFGASITPGTVLILDGLPAERRSVASAVNDITREVGGVLGIAMLSSVLIAAYRTEVAAAASGLPPELAGTVDGSAGAALGVAAGLGPAGDALATAARTAFAAGTGAAMAVGAGVLLGAAVLCLLTAPRRPERAGSPAGARAGR
jgi:EmrB/QacA subfamily drug resistance transporter